MSGANRASDGIEERPATSIEDARRCVDLFTLTWGLTPITFDTVRAIQLGAGQLICLFDAERLAAAAVGFYGHLTDGAGYLFSHAVAVHPGLRSRGLGRRIKQQQRERSRREGLREIRWTFDPLREGNARFNFDVLDAEGIAYLPNVYGALDDELNRGAVTDRILLRWPTDPEPAPSLGDIVAVRMPRYWEIRDAQPDTAAEDQRVFSERMRALFNDGYVIRRFNRAERTYLLVRRHTTEFG